MFQSHKTKGFLICFFITLAVLALYFFNAFDSLELKTIDARFQVRGSRPINPDIAIVAIDEVSIEKLGRWPWPRKYHGALIRKLKEAGAKVVAFDSLFSEGDKDNPASDAEFVSAAHDFGHAVLAMHFSEGIQQRLFGKSPLFPFSPLYSQEGDEGNPYIGFVNFDPDRDGVSRHAYLYALDGETVYPSLAVGAFAMSQRKTIEEILPSLPIVLDKDPHTAHNDLVINFAYEPTRDTYPIYSYHDVLDGRVPTAALKDKMIFVGATAAGLGDIKPIPYVPKYFGVMIHANVLDNLIAGNYMRESSGFVTGVYTFLIGLFLGFLLPRLGLWKKLGVFFVVLAGWIALSQYLFASRQYILQMMPVLAVIVSGYAGMLFYNLVVEEREKRRIKGSFKQYLSPKIIDILTKDPSKLKLGGEEREVSIFFLDIAGFTTMSEALKPTQLVEVMNECLTEFSHVILKHDGLINKYIGDCIMAFWNAPADQPDHAAQACLAALDCIKALPDLNRRFKERGLPSIDCRVGVNTGVVVVGNMGSAEKFDYTVMGDPVNLASRLEGANKQYHTHIMISDVTFEKAKGVIEARDLDLIRVKGKKEPRKVFEVLSRKEEFSEEWLEGRKRYHNGLSLYRKQQFEDAIAAFEEVFDYLPNDHVTRVYLERARVFVNHPPPPGWDGVYEMTTK